MTAPARPGRPPVSSPEEIERVAMLLFTEHGFDDTTVDDIATAAGISRRSFFRYFGSKNDVVWGRFDAGLEHLRAVLEAADPAVPWPAALSDAVVDFNRFSEEQEAVHRARMELILHVPALQAYSTLMYAQWRGVVADFVGRRLGLRSDDFVPRLVGHLALAAAVAAYEQWLVDPAADLATLLADGLRWLDAGHE